MKYAVFSLAVLAGLAGGCGSDHDDSVLPAPPTIESRTITTAELPSEFDASRTYRCPRPNLEDPQGILRALVGAGIAVTRGWQPLDDRCLDPIGPTLTVELVAPDARMQEKGLELGVGRLWCATTLTEYTVSGARF